MDTAGRSDNHDLSLLGRHYVGLFTLARRTDNSRLVRQAARLGTNLLARRRKPRGLVLERRWPDTGSTGLSHGASGIATALLQLAAAMVTTDSPTAPTRASVTNTAGYRAEGNWPDLATAPKSNDVSQSMPSCAWASASAPSSTPRSSTTPCIVLEACCCLGDHSPAGPRRARAENTMSFSGLLPWTRGVVNILHEDVFRFSSAALSLKKANSIADIAAMVLGPTPRRAGGSRRQCGVLGADLEVPGSTPGVCRCRATTTCAPPTSNLRRRRLLP